MQAGSTDYASEADLSKEFCNAIENPGGPWGQLAFLTEFFYARGRTDVVAVDEQRDVIAFELKLERWTVALHQAYRNTSFAHRSYVVVPEHTAARAERRPAEFARRSVGLCYLRRGEVVIAVRAPRQEPIQPWLSEKVIARTRSDAGGIEGDRCDGMPAESGARR
jgi:hypothetical protein